MSLHKIVRLYVMAMAAASLLALSGSAHADITITGGTGEQQAAIRSVYGNMPACCHKSGCVCVRILDGSTMDTYLQCCAASQSVKLVNAGSIDGLFQNTMPAITLRSSQTVSDTFAHEYGHYIWLNVLTPDQRNEYAKDYKAERAAHKLVSAYADVSLEEGFAEAYSFYIRQPLTLAKCDPKSSEFLSQCLH